MLEILQSQYRTIRGRQVVLDAHVARFYGVSTKRLNEQVRRNLVRFPEDFAFRLTAAEAADTRRELAAHRLGRGGSRHAPRVFTECGILMAAFVLHTPQAIETGITLVRAIVASAGELTLDRDLQSQLADIERRLAGEPGSPEGIWRLLTESR